MFLLATGCVFGQNPDEWKRYGDEAWDEKDYYGAAHYYSKGLAQDSEYLEIHWKMAESYRRYNDYRRALTAYESLFKKDKDEKHPKALFYFALMLKHNERYLEAQDHFDKYASVYKYEDPYLTKKAQRETESCLWAAKHENTSEDKELSLLPQPLNSVDSELSPWLTPDSVLHFASLRFTNASGMKLSGKDAKREAFARNYRATDLRQNTAQTMEGSDQNELHIDVPADLNFEGKHMAGYFADEELGMAFLTACDPLCSVYWSFLDETGKPTEFEYLDAINQSGYTTTQPHAVKIDGEIYLFFASDRARGRGNMDIWYSQYRRDKFMRPRNLRIVNDKGNEVTPHYDTTERVLYFSSDWHDGFGGYDVFKSEGKPPQFKTPVNLQKPVNSAANDLYYRPTRSYNVAYFVSNREGGYAVKGESCCNNMYSVPLDSVPVQIRPDTAPEPDEVATLTQQDTAPTPKDTPVLVTETTADEADTTPLVSTGRPVFTLDLPRATFYFPNDQPDARTYATTTNKTYFDVKDLFTKQLAEYTENNPRFKEDFYKPYVQNSNKILKEILNTLEETLEKEEKVFVFIRGFSSPLAASRYNENLSKRRINSIENTIMQRPVLQRAKNEGRLTFIASAVGEYESQREEVSDDRTNLKASVYSTAAAKSRRVEIDKVWVQRKGSSSGIPAFDGHVKYVKKGSREVSFSFTNVGNATLEWLIDELPEGITLKNPDVKTAPGKSARLLFSLDKEPRGKVKVKLETTDGIKLILYIVKD